MVAKIPNLKQNHRNLLLYIGDYPGSPHGLTYYSFTDSKAIAELQSHHGWDGYWPLGFVHEIKYKGGVLPLPFASYVPIVIEKQSFDGEYLNIKAIIRTHFRDPQYIKPFDGQKLEFKLKWN